MIGVPYVKESRGNRWPLKSAGSVLKMWPPISGWLRIRFIDGSKKEVSRLIEWDAFFDSSFPR